MLENPQYMLPTQRYIIRLGVLCSKGFEPVTLSHLFGVRVISFSPMIPYQSFTNFEDKMLISFNLIRI